MLWGVTSLFTAKTQNHQTQRRVGYIIKHKAYFIKNMKFLINNNMNTQFLQRRIWGTELNLLMFKSMIYMGSGFPVPQSHQTLLPNSFSQQLQDVTAHDLCLLGAKMHCTQTETKAVLLKTINETNINNWMSIKCSLSIYALSRKISNATESKFKELYLLCKTICWRCQIKCVRAVSQVK